MKNYMIYFTNGETTLLQGVLYSQYENVYEFYTNGFDMGQRMNVKFSFPMINVQYIHKVK